MTQETQENVEQAPAEQEWPKYVRVRIEESKQEISVLSVYAKAVGLKPIKDGDKFKPATSRSGAPLPARVLTDKGGNPIDSVRVPEPEAGEPDPETSELAIDSALPQEYVEARDPEGDDGEDDTETAQPYNYSGTDRI